MIQAKEDELSENELIKSGQSDKYSGAKTLDVENQKTESEISEKTPETMDAPSNAGESAEVSIIY